MKTLNIYVMKSFLITFCMAIGILTFCMAGVRIAQALGVIANGIPIKVFFSFVLYLMPMVLTYTAPWAVMSAVMLVFGRLSADSEITAMRACGVSILQIVAPILLFTLLTSAFCLYLQLQLGPPCYGRSRTLLSEAAIDQPTAVFEPGHPIYYGNATIWIGDITGDDILHDVQIYTNEKLSEDDLPNRDITAKTAKMVVDKDKQILSIVMYDCIVDDKASGIRSFQAETSLNFAYGREINSQRMFKRPKFLTFKELLARIRITKTQEKRLPALECQLEIELNRRIALALSPIAFLLLGLPLAIRTSRKETSVGLFLSVLLAGLFFLLILLFNSLASFPRLYPQYLLWLPNFAFQIVGAVLIYRLSQR